MIVRAFGACLLCLVGVSILSAEPATVTESARQIPVAYDVDVVVVGGTTGAVSSAVAAAESGAKVLLITPRPYLGDDMTATLRLWLEEGEEPASPLARRIYDDPAAAANRSDPNALDFTYTADQPSMAVHKDTPQQTALHDGRWNVPSNESVQYEDDVNITADLGKPQPLREIRLRAFHRSSDVGGTNFKVQSIGVSISDDGKSWKEVGQSQNERTDDGNCTLAVATDATARHVRVCVKMADDVERILLGEIEIIGAAGNRPPPVTRRPPVRPLHVKRVLDDALLEAGVDFLYGCYATDVLKDDDGNLCGIVMANRAGRQAVRAKTVIDATDTALIAELAGAKFRQPPKSSSGLLTAYRVVIGGEVRSGEHVQHRTIEPAFAGPAGKGGTFNIIEYRLGVPLADDTYAAYAKADQLARSMTYDPDQQFTSDALTFLRSRRIEGQLDEPKWNSEATAADLPLAAFRPKGADRLYVLSPCADVLPSADYRKLVTRPVFAIEVGARIGQAAAEEAKAITLSQNIAVAGRQTENSSIAGEVHEVLRGVRPTQTGLPTVPQPTRSLPVLGRYDVVVIGGGTGGAPAGIAAGRQGAKTLVVELLHGLGGVGTSGAISRYYWGNRVGFTASVPGAVGWFIEEKMEWYRSELLKAGADVWFGTLGCGTLVANGRVVGAVVATPQGRGVVLAKTVIDSTGNADIAVAAGAESIYTDHTEFGMQGTGLPGRKLGGAYNNTDFSIVDETDMLDVWHFLVYAKHKYPNAFDQGRLIDTRERRRIVGGFTMTICDQMLGRTYPDSIVRTRSNFDTHGYTIDPYFELTHPEKRGFDVYVPYRCLLPTGLDGILVTGLGVSAHRDAIPLIRMQADIQNQGYAAGTAAAMAAAADCSVREIDVRRLQKHLVEIGNLPESVLTDKDSLPLSDEQIAAAVDRLKDRDATAFAAVLAHPNQSLLLLQKAFAAAADDDKFTYAHALAVFGDASGVDLLMERVRSTVDWDIGWNFRGMGQFGNSSSPLDVLLIALGRAGDRKALPAVLEKLEKLSPGSDFSHHRAAALSLELLKDPAAAAPLAKLLSKPEMSGYWHHTVQEAARRDAESPGGTNAVKTRRESLRELFLARALYRCGDYNGLGEKTLRAYTQDLRGHLSRHATAILQSGGK